MGTSPDEGQLIAMLFNLMNAKRTTEVGVFTGCCRLLPALNIVDDGKFVVLSFVAFDFAVVDADKGNWINYRG
ncbi:hypothetical protein Vadar_007496 [Vaccinium darrowii]|uniref:Uncharacterized protein n=1 Tax=Vaccinium darrowii TaxID=229202 RepID=A0ACB7YCM4_9ERIC|nr:hypothetical protein Vadar_007496 [Vaccinium darrowii]